MDNSQTATVLTYCVLAIHSTISTSTSTEAPTTSTANALSTGETPNYATSIIFEPCYRCSTVFLSTIKCRPTVDLTALHGMSNTCRELIVFLFQYQ